MMAADYQNMQEWVNITYMYMDLQVVGYIK